MLEKESMSDIKTWSIDKVYINYIKQGTFLSIKNAENVQQKLVQGHFSILVNRPKQPMQARHFFENKIF